MYNTDTKRRREIAHSYRSKLEQNPSYALAGLEKIGELRDKDIDRAEAVIGYYKTLHFLHRLGLDVDYAAGDEGTLIHD